MSKEIIIKKELLEKLYLEDKMPIKAISEKIKRGEGTVLRYMRIHGIKSRPQHQLLGRKPNPKRLENLQTINIGRRLSEETRVKISLANKKPKSTPKKRIKTDDGYIIVYRPKHPMCNSIGYILEHRLIMSEHLGRLLNRKEVVHHKNHIKDDNKIENLMLIESLSKHNSLHNNSETRKRMSNMMKEIRAKKFWSGKKRTA